MKWLSVKKYKPKSGQECFFRLVSGSTLEGFWNCKTRLWEAEGGTFLDEYVTHFCAPDPIEIEEE